MKILVLGDPHGKKPRISRSLAYDAVFCPGDFCDDTHVLPLMAKGRKAGKSWQEVAGKRVVSIQKDMIRKARDVITYLNTLKKTVYVVPGNWDAAITDDFDRVLLRKSKNVVNCHYKIREHTNFIVIGYGETSSPEYPVSRKVIQMYTKKEIQSTIKEYSRTYGRMEKLFEKAKLKKKPIIFLTHNVPFQTKLDTIHNDDSIFNGEHFGSHLIRRMIMTYEPLLCIGGHMHENPGFTKLQHTLCVNAGYGRHDDAFMIDLDSLKVEKV